MEDRKVPEVRPPPFKPLASSLLFKTPDKPDLKLLREHFFEGGKIHPEDYQKIIESSKVLFEAEPNILNIEAPVYVVGDLHGQFYDFLNVLNEHPSSIDPERPNIHDTAFKWLFLGDYVDRGTFGVEVVTYLFSLKLNYPKRIFILRGNHESRLMTDYHNFKTECHKKCGYDNYELTMDCFCALPIACTVVTEIGNYFCVHAGISPSARTLEEIKSLNRFIEIPGEGAICDLLWSDPLSETTADGLNESDMQEWFEVDYVANPDRGCSYVYGCAAVLEFVETNDFLCIVRAHDVREEGFELNMLKQERNFPYVITVFSAPNYCDKYGNKGALLLLKPDWYEMVQFEAVDHPFCLANQQNAFEYAMPFLSDLCTSLILTIIKNLPDDETEAVTANQETAKRILKEKILTVAKLRKRLQLLKEENEALLKLKGLKSGKSVSVDQSKLLEEFNLKHFPTYTQVREMDKFNELIPSEKNLVENLVQTRRDFWKEKAQQHLTNQQKQTIIRRRKSSLNVAKKRNVLVKLKPTDIDDQVQSMAQKVRISHGKVNWIWVSYSNNKITVSASGDDGYTGLISNFQDTNSGFGYLKVSLGTNHYSHSTLVDKYVFLVWIGPRVSGISRGKVISDLSQVKTLFKDFCLELTYNDAKDLNEDILLHKLRSLSTAHNKIIKPE